MPPESQTDNPVYGPSMDVLSFGGIVLHTFNQQWPHPSEQVHFDPKTRRKVALMEVERRQQYLDKLEGEAEELRPLVEECLDDDPSVRPTIAAVYDRVKESKDAYMNVNEPSKNIIALCQENIQIKNDMELTRTENDQLRIENHQLNAEIGQLRQQLSSRTCPAMQHKESPLGHNGGNAGRGKGKLKHKSMAGHFAQSVKEDKLNLLHIVFAVFLACLVSLWIENNNLTSKNKALKDGLHMLKDQNQNITELNQKLFDWVEQTKTNNDIVVRQVYYIKKWINPIGELGEHIQHVIQYCKLKKKLNGLWSSPDEVDRLRLQTLRQLIGYDIGEDDDDIIVPLVTELIGELIKESEKYLNALLSMNFIEMKQLQDTSIDQKIEDAMFKFLANVSNLKSQRGHTTLQVQSLAGMVVNMTSELISRVVQQVVGVLWS